MFSLHRYVNSPAERIQFKRICEEVRIAICCTVDQEKVMILAYEVLRLDLGGTEDKLCIHDKKVCYRWSLSNHQLCTKYKNKRSMQSPFQLLAIRRGPSITHPESIDCRKYDVTLVH